MIYEYNLFENDGSATIFLGFVFIFLISLFFAIRAAKKQTEKFRNVATTMGLSFIEKVPSDFLFKMSDFKLFNMGSSKKATNLIEGEDFGIKFSIFNYEYAIRFHRYGKMCSQSVYFVQSEKINLPSFSLGPKLFFYEIGDVLGSKDIEFDTHPLFSKNYILKGEDENA
ncbi:MAG: hypothetical protein KAS12_03915, partial [Candidatus Aenigmarchaeota archaeon]|nr:hypothetical protein [Candidatus Aenigmarchaeota archaeon]